MHWARRILCKRRCPIPCCSTVACSGPKHSPGVWRVRWVHGASSLCTCCKTTIRTLLSRVARSLTALPARATHRALAVARPAATSSSSTMTHRHRRACACCHAEPKKATRYISRIAYLRCDSGIRCFHLVSTVADTAWQPGELVDLTAGDFVRLPPVATVVQQQDASGPRERPVRLTTSLTELGRLEMHCIATDDASQRWLLELQLRRDDAEHDVSAASRNPSLDKAIELIDRTFGARSANVDPKEVKRLRAGLEQLLGPRQSWDSALLRELFGALWERAGRRRRSADHERLWLNLAGYCVRPGFGYPLDEWRIEQLWSLFDDGIQYVNEGQVWSEWWTLWRRAAGGLPEDAQLQVLDAMAWLQAAAGTKRHKLPFDPTNVGQADMLRLYASLERIPVDRKVEIAEQLLVRLQRPSENLQGWWAVGRIGARRPFYGSAHGVVPADVATRWLDAILALDWKKVEPAVFAAAQIARMTGDRSRDLPETIRETVVRRLEAANAPSAWVDMVREVVTLDNADTGRVFGESLPAGLKLIVG